MIEVRNVTKRYGEFTAVDDLSFTVERGEVCVLIGPSGCGKSTTLKLINRMIEPDAGELLIDGRGIRGESPELLRRRIGYVIQSIGLFPHMSVAGNIAVVPRLLHWEHDRIARRVDELLELVGLDPSVYRAKRPRELSGGEAQRIGVARALAADPPILLMDEPFGAVDPLGRQVLQDEFLTIQRQLRKTVLFVTHDLDEAIRLADRVILLARGRLVQNDAPETLLSHPRNKFVRTFVGADRALKRLARFSVADHLQPAAAIAVRDPEFVPKTRQAREAGAQYVWITDHEGRLFGWLNLAESAGLSNPRTAITRANSNEEAVRPSWSLKEALSRMLGQAVRIAPVVDDGERLVGEISLAAIERVTGV